MEEKPVQKCHKKKSDFGNSFNTCTRPVIKDKEMNCPERNSLKLHKKGDNSNTPHNFQVNTAPAGIV